MSEPQDLQSLAAPLRARFLDMHEAREVAFGASRDVIRDAANAIRAVHRGELDRADELIVASRTAYVRAREVASRHPVVEHGGFLQDAAKEYAEARITRAATQGEPVPSPEDVDVDDGSWLHGLAETVGELRRAALDRVRAGDIAGAEALLETQQEILAVLVTIDVPDALTKGLRRATDGARAITERTRGDLTAAAGQRRLREALDAHRAVIERMLDGVGEP